MPVHLTVNKVPREAGYYQNPVFLKRILFFKEETSSKINSSHTTSSALVSVCFLESQSELHVSWFAETHF